MITTVLVVCTDNSKSSVLQLGTCYLDSQDSASAAIRRARASFVPPAGTDVQIGKIRSHSSRQRAINDLKVSGVSAPVGKRFARIASDRVWDGYGQLTTDQVEAGLKRSSAFQELQCEIYNSADA